MSDENPADFPNRPKHTYPGIDSFFAAEPEWADEYDDVVERVVRADGELSRKNRELIILAYTAITGRADVCQNHIEAAFEHGASSGEVRQTIQLAGHIGGALSLVTGAKALDGLD